MICLFVYQTAADVAEKLMDRARSLGEVRETTSHSFLLDTKVAFDGLYKHFEDILTKDEPENTLLISVIKSDTFDGFIPRDTIKWIISRL